MAFRNAAVALFSFTSAVYGHGTVSGAVVDGVYHQGYNPSMQYSNPPPTVIGWSIPADLGNGFIAPTAYGSDDIICHLGATPAGTHANVKAGDAVTMQWTPWAHRGAVLDYLANCNGPCETVDKTKLKFFKIDGVGIIEGTTWATDKLIQDNSSWTVTIPSTIQAGNYVLRHEILALHAANQPNGAQNYPQCISLTVTGGGSDAPDGISATEFYKADDPGVNFNLYTDYSTYIVPGPPVWTASGNAAAPTQATAPAAATTTAQPTAPAPAPTTIKTSVVTKPKPATTKTTVKPTTKTTKRVPTSTTVHKVVPSTATYPTSAPTVAAPTFAAPTIATSTIAESTIDAPTAAFTFVTGVTSSSAPTAVAQSAPDGSYSNTDQAAFWNQPLPAKPTGAAGVGVPLPSVTLPQGTTPKDLVDWLVYAVYGENSQGISNARRHARALSA